MTYFVPTKNKYYDSGNSTSTPLAADATFTGTWIEVTDYSEAIISLLTDQDAATNGLKIESSLNGIDVSRYHTFTPLSNTPEGHYYPSTLDSKYLRVIYTNGATAQTNFNLVVTLFQNASEEGHVHPIEYQIGADHPASINRSVLVAKNPSNIYGNIGSTAGGNLKIALEEVEANVTEEIGLYPIGTGTNGSVTLTSADTAYAVPASAPNGSYKILIQNNSDSDIYIGYQNTNTNGIKLLPGDTVADKLGSGQQLYSYCATAGKEITYITKLIN